MFRNNKDRGVAEEREPGTGPGNEVEEVTVGQDKVAGHRDVTQDHCQNFGFYSNKMANRGVNNKLLLYRF